MMIKRARWIEELSGKPTDILRDGDILYCSNCGCKIQVHIERVGKLAMIRTPDTCPKCQSRMKVNEK